MQPFAEWQGDAFHLILRNDVYETWRPCFELPCNQINACLEDYGDEYEECVLQYL